MQISKGHTHNFAPSCSPSQPDKICAQFSTELNRESEVEGGGIVRTEYGLVAPGCAIYSCGREFETAFLFITFLVQRDHNAVPNLRP